MALGTAHLAPFLMFPRGADRHLRRFISLYIPGPKRRLSPVGEGFHI